jgi:short-subunit dehydrogenase
MDIQNKVAIMTGASAGVGLAAARLFAQHGAKVALVARSTDKLNALAAELKDSLPITGDMSQEADIKGMIETVHKHYGRIDILVNNAGRGMYSPIEHVNFDQYREIMELNVFGPLYAMQTVIPIMRQQGGGLIINISSGVSKAYYPNLAAYASTKYALNALSLTARTELAKDNIRVCVVYPGRTATDFGRNAAGSGGGQQYGRPANAPAGNQPVGQDGQFHPDFETAEQVAVKILEAVQTEAAEVFADNLMRSQ